MQPFVIAIVQQKGGSGKSTLAAHLAVALALENLKTILIDTDPQQTIVSWSNIRKENISHENINLKIASSTGWKVGNEISKNYDADVIILDSPPHMETETKSSIRAANLIIVPCQPSPNDLWATSKTIEIINKENKPMILLINRSPYHSKLTKTVESMFDENIQKFTLGNRVLFASSMLNGKTAIETEPNSSAANEIVVITKYLYNVIKNN